MFIHYKSQTKYIGVLDADLEYSPNDLKRLFLDIELNDGDVACGSRFIGNFERKNLYFKNFKTCCNISNFLSVYE